MTARNALAFAVVSCVLLGVSAALVVRRAPAVDPDVPSHLETWSHQGYTANAPPNSLSSVTAAIEAGADGVELDVHFDAPQGRFIVSRIREPYQSQDGRLLTLEEVLVRHGAATKFWIDLKNLTHTNSDEVASRMDSLLQSLGVKERTFVESTRGWALRELRSAGLKTIYTIDLKPGDWSHVPRIIAATAMVALNDHSVIGVPHGSMNAAFMFFFGHRPLFVFTVNDPSALAELERLPSVRVVLSDHLFVGVPRTSRPARGS